MFWEGKTLEQGIKELLNIQSKSTPETVGPPFSIVRIMNKKIKWYSKGRCQ